jgi:hypothetical protein
VGQTRFGLGKLALSRWVNVAFLMADPILDDMAAISSAPSIGNKAVFQRRATTSDVQQKVDDGVRARAVLGNCHVPLSNAS